MPLFSRRQIVGAGGVALSALVLPVLPLSASAAVTKVGLLLPGKRDDGGFMQAGYAGFEQAVSELKLDAVVVDGVRPQKDELVAALRKLAADKPQVIAAHGGQCNEAAKVVAADHPDIQFLVIQGGVEGANLTSYEVLQEESAWLAGAAAALLTTTGVVGHISGIRVPPGLKGRAAYAAGVAHAKPDVKLLTTFCGEQDDVALAHKVAVAQADAGADIIFTMLNAGRPGAIAACREKKIRQIGNVRDWGPVAPDVFVASAIADVGIAMRNAVSDAASGRLVPGKHVKLGVSSGNAVRLALAPEVPADVRAKVEAYAADIALGKIRVSTEYSGVEFQP
ncbi:ABC transporter substrate-binding protein [Azorhizobium oxalatiphilum]|uniref:ABC transporter substrate-binding protein n=1 Tax=Azorhizobium oxalatiphilum TaxID=980631 RepID=A0A917BTV5_9HYPH|nr:BMP family protein [Azorhizobium oxalatiphilum]GGF55695.1 ABC transporter substrate-binding protein [Azorhizobium oxalatiphilum]